MKRLFIDSSVLYSAVYSSKGYSRDLLLMAAQSDIILVASSLVLEETRRNLAESAPEVLELLGFILNVIPFELVNLNKEEVLEAAQWVVLKDAPILAAARKAEVDLLVTLDQKHLLGKPELALFLGARIVTPKEAVSIIKSTG